MVDRRRVILGTATLAAVGTAGHSVAARGDTARSGMVHGDTAGSGVGDSGTAGRATAVSASTSAGAEPHAGVEPYAAAEPHAAVERRAAAKPDVAVKSDAAATSDRATGSGAAAEAPATMPAERVLGIGGFFFRSHDPKKLAQWYQLHLGIDPIPTEYGHHGWQQAAGETAFAPFPMDTDYFGSKQQDWMVNYRVRDLDAMVAQLRKAQIEVTVDPQKYPNGRFARLHDPEGNPVELWEPLAPK